MTTEHSLYPELSVIKELVYDPCGFELTALKRNVESVEYGACSFRLDGQRIEHRVSKITPKKTGQFVTIWKRNKNGVTEPFDISDGIDFVVITSTCEGRIGQFIFPRSVLAEKGILSQNGKDGKRGIRVYPSWCTPTNRQAEKTQRWQTDYFVTRMDDNSIDFDRVRRLLDIPNKSLSI